MRRSYVAETNADGETRPAAARTGATDMVGKALGLLSRLGDFPDGAPAAELARASSLPLSTARAPTSSLFA